MFILPVVTCLIVDIYEIVRLTAYVRELSHIIVLLTICAKLII